MSGKVVTLKYNVWRNWWIKTFFSHFSFSFFIPVFAFLKIPLLAFPWVNPTTRRINKSSIIVQKIRLLYSTTNRFEHKNRKYCMPSLVLSQLLLNRRHHVKIHNIALFNMSCTYPILFLYFLKVHYSTLLHLPHSYFAVSENAEIRARIF